MKSLPYDSSAEDEAALWAAKLDGDTLTSAERAALDAWLEQNPAHRRLLSQYCQFSTDLEEQLPTLVIAGAVKMPAAAKPARRSKARVIWFSTALAAAAALVVGVFATHPAPEPQTVATSVAQRRTLKLADGSIVELNARTSLLVDLSGSERHIRMADGQAFFTVAKDKSRPFIVETPAGSVRVTGTVFDVHAESARDLAVTVVEGSVRVSPSQELVGSGPAAHALTANDQLMVRDGVPCTVRKLSSSELDDSLAWRRGEAVFDHTSLAAALAQFSRYHGRAVMADDEVAKLAVGGHYRLDDLDGFLSDLPSFLPVRVARDETTGAIRVSARPAP
jgi:transmembrane sensor